MGSSVALLEVNRYGGLTPPPEIVSVKGTPEYAVALDGDSVNVIAGSLEDETAPLPQELSASAKHVARRKIAPRPIILLIFTKTPYPVLRHHSNKMAKVLASIGILSKRRGRITRPSHYPRKVHGTPPPGRDFGAQDKFVAPRKNQRYHENIPE